MLAGAYRFTIQPTSRLHKCGMNSSIMGGIKCRALSTAH